MHLGADVPHDAAHAGAQYAGVGDGRRGSNTCYNADNTCCNADNRLQAKATSGSLVGGTRSHVKARLSLKFDHIASDGGAGGGGPAGPRSAAAGAPRCTSPSPVRLGTFRGSVLVSRATGDVPVPGHEGARWKGGGGLDGHKHGGEHSGVCVGGLHAASGQWEREREKENDHCASPPKQVMMV